MAKRKQKESSIDSEGTPAGPPAVVASVSFPATIPPTETAIKIHGDGGARIILDVAESDLGKFLPAVAFRGRRITVQFSER